MLSVPAQVLLDQYNSVNICHNLEKSLSSKSQFLSIVTLHLQRDVFNGMEVLTGLSLQPGKALIKWSCFLSPIRYTLAQAIFTRMFFHWLISINQIRPLYFWESQSITKTNPWILFGFRLLTLRGQNSLVICSTNQVPITECLLCTRQKGH